MKVKVCGLKYADNIKDVIKLKADYIGFIFHKGSPRFINENLSFDNVRQFPASVQKVGVFVNESSYHIMDKVAHYDLDFIQLHGAESSSQCAELKPFVKVIKAFGINGDFDFEELKDYESEVSFFLFDNWSAHNGGSGKRFNWDLLKNYRFKIPFLLSGGIGLEHLEEIKNIKHPKLEGVDLNSKFEIKPGLKDIVKLNEFIKTIKQ
jgi:phosphoribosylanthranilate isomerase